MKREVELLGYLPEFLQRFGEYQILADAQTPEIERLGEEAGHLLDNSFIRTADIQGMKRWEKLLGIAGAGEMEERRAAILGKWNRTIPYTMVRLYEYLDALAAREDYKIKMSSIDCRLELVAEDLPLYTLRAMRDLVRAMLPANMVFVAADRIPGVAAVLWDVQVDLRMISAFYPRYNTPPHYLDGATRLDGKYLLNGYLSGQSLDFYPLALQVGGAAEWRTASAGAVDMQTRFCPWVWQPVGNTAGLGIWGAVRAQVHPESGLYLSGEDRIKAESAVQAEIQGSAVQVVEQGASWCAVCGAEVPGDFQVDALQVSGTAGKAHDTASESHLVIEKDLWRLDGSVRLDGSRILDAEIYEEEI